jgi:hypothetical protein
MYEYRLQQIGHIENDVFNNYSVAVYVFVAAIIFSPRLCLAKLRWIGIYEDVLRCHDIHIKCHNNLFKHLAFNKAIFIFLIIRKVS